MALQTFLKLWGLRSRVGINIFLAAPCAATQLLLQRERFLFSFFRTDRINPSFTLTLDALVAMFMLHVVSGFTLPDRDGATGSEMLAALALLGIAQTMFLMFPFGEAGLWWWADADLKT